MFAYFYLKIRIQSLTVIALLHGRNLCAFQDLPSQLFVALHFVMLTPPSVITKIIRWLQPCPLTGTLMNQYVAILNFICNTVSVHVQHPMCYSRRGYTLTYKMYYRNCVRLKPQTRGSLHACTLLSRTGGCSCTDI